MDKFHSFNGNRENKKNTRSKLNSFFVNSALLGHVMGFDWD